MDGKSFKDRRKYRRFQTKDLDSGAKDLEGPRPPPDIVDSVGVGMSPEGINFLSKEPLKPGSVTEVDVAIPFQSRPLVLKGEVRWSKPVKTADGKEVYETGLRLQIGETDEGKFLLYICTKMTERIKALEEQLSKQLPK